MKIVRIKADNKVTYGVLTDDIIHAYNGDPFQKLKSFIPSSKKYKSSEIKLLAPCIPSKLVCLGLNYRNHIEETGLPMPELPLLFLKPSSAVIGNEDYIELPNDIAGPARPDIPPKDRIDYEGEIGVVIGKEAKGVSENNALDYVLGYTCVNDVSARYAQEFDGQWTRGKGFDTFAPVGPCIETEAVHDNLTLNLYVNGDCRQSFNSRNLLFGIPMLISYISHVMTLMPGDIISTGTAAGIGPMHPGDVVEIEISGVGKLRNYVKMRGL